MCSPLGFEVTLFSLVWVTQRSTSRHTFAGMEHRPATNRSLYPARTTGQTKLDRTGQTASKTS